MTTTSTASTTTAVKPGAGGQWRHFNHHQDKKVDHVVKYRYWDGHGWSDWYKDVSHKTGLGH